MKNEAWSDTNRKAKVEMKERKNKETERKEGHLVYEHRLTIEWELLKKRGQQMGRVNEGQIKEE